MQSYWHFALSHPIYGQDGGPDIPPTSMVGDLCESKRRKINIQLFGHANRPFQGRNTGVSGQAPNITMSASSIFGSLVFAAIQREHCSESGFCPVCKSGKRGATCQ